MTLVWISVSLTAAAGLLAMHLLVSRSGQASRPTRAPASGLQRQPRPYPSRLQETNGHRAAAHRLPTVAQRMPDSRLEELQEALARQQLVLHYQPEVTLADQQVVGLEALLRWQHPSKGLLPPGAFIAVAEQTDLIIPLGRWVLQEACAALSRLQRQHPGLGMSINVSPRQFENDPSWADAVDRVLAATGIAPAALTLEITETALMLDTADCRATLQALREVGVGIAIDDFGTGYSSLAYLSDLPASVIKLDKRFVDNLQHGRRHRDVVYWIRELADHLGIIATAEGIETARQSQVLQSLGYARGQGFYICRPAPEDAIASHPLLERPAAPERCRARAWVAGAAATDLSPSVPLKWVT